MNLPKVTILIANNNYNHYLNDSISSAISQTYPLLQICIIDDGSIDGSWESICQLFDSYEHKTLENSSGIIYKQRLDNNRKYTAIKLPQSYGPSYARNAGIEATLHETDYYVILDADDIMAPNKVERFIQKFIEYPEVGIVYADYDNLNIHSSNIIREYKENYSRNRILQECIIHSGAGISKRALLETRDEYGFYDINLRCVEDWDLWLRISDKFMAAHIPESLTLVRVHQQNSTYSVKNEIWQKCWQRVHQKTTYRLQK